MCVVPCAWTHPRNVSRVTVARFNESAPSSFCEPHGSARVSAVRARRRDAFVSAARSCRRARVVVCEVRGLVEQQR